MLGACGEQDLYEKMSSELPSLGLSTAEKRPKAAALSSMCYNIGL